MTEPAPGMRRVLRTAVLAVTTLALVAACTAGSESGSRSDGGQATPGAPVIAITPAKGEVVGPTETVVVKATDGRLDSVEVTADDGSVVPGRLVDNDTEWRSDRKLLQFGAKYKVSAAASSGTVSSTATSTFNVKETKGLRAFVSPDSRTVGVGMPIIVKLTATPKSRAAVESRLTVTASNPVEGAWRWLSDTEVHWRPKDFWPANTDVQVKAKLKGVKFGKNIYGDYNTNASFTIGDAQITTVDVERYTMTVTENGKIVRVIPVTTGEDAYKTRAGIKVIVSKEKEVIMDSTTVDIPANSPDAYLLKVKNAMRLTWSGEYLHAAPWSVRSQGVANVSHGCTGMSNANAQWMFDFSQIGDVVKYVNSSRPLEQGNGYTDWNVPWSEWLQGSALV